MTCLDRARQPEVGELGAAVRRQQDVPRGDVAMNDPRRVRRCQRLSDLCRDLAGLRQVQITRGETIRERHPVDELHDDEEAIRHFFHRVDGDDRGVAQRGCDTGLAHQAPARTLVAGRVAVQDLDRDVPLQPGVPGAEHLTQCLHVRSDAEADNDLECARLVKTRPSCRWSPSVRADLPSSGCQDPPAT